MIDRKYKILATNPCSGSVHTEDDAILFLAKDLAVLQMLEKYSEECNILGCDDTHLDSVYQLIKRVEEYQRDHGAEIPDTNTPCEIDRCIRGKV